MPGDPAWDLMACVNAVWMRLRADARRRWRAWLGVVVLVGLFGGIVTATAAGARRTDDAYSRFVVANHGAEYLIGDFISQPGGRRPGPATSRRPAGGRRGGFLPRVGAGRRRRLQPGRLARRPRLRHRAQPAQGAARGACPIPPGPMRPSRTSPCPAPVSARRVRVPLVASTDGDTHTPDLAGRACLGHVHRRGYRRGARAVPSVRRQQLLQRTELLPHPRVLPGAQEIGRRRLSSAWCGCARGRRPLTPSVSSRRSATGRPVCRASA